MWVDLNGNPVTTAEKEGLLLYRGGTVCNDNFSYNSAEAICRLLGHSSYSSWSSGSKWPEIQNNYSINMSDVQCSSGDWSSCTYTTSNSNYHCDHSEDIFLICSGKLGRLNLINHLQLLIRLMHSHGHKLL